ncbi:MAG: hypothetical protein QOJ42_5402, partial [Acidobacteriaceae bacterium]|nr:hypothetical protein [Acidobacteriaceae bacterium]
MREVSDYETFQDFIVEIGAGLLPH